MQVLTTTMTAVLQACFTVLDDKSLSLYAGSYYNYDCSTGGHHDSVMADQLAGHWFLKASGLQDDEVRK